MTLQYLVTEKKKILQNEWEVSLKYCFNTKTILLDIVPILQNPLLFSKHFLCKDNLFDNQDLL